MPGYSRLTYKDFAALFQGSEDSVVHVPATKKLNPYSFERRGQVIIVHTPIEVGSLAEFLKDIEKRTEVANEHLLLGVVGQSAFEHHIVTLHIPPNGEKPTIYDSKYCNPERFFSLKHAKITAGNLIHSIVHALNPFAASTREINLSHLNSNRLSTANYHVLGTQSFFDDVSCGYHTGNNIKALANLLQQGIKPTAELLLTESNNPITSSAELLTKVAPDKVDMSYSSFLKKAWRDTFLPLVDENEQDKFHFGHYFMGWPSQKKGSRAAYVITLKFLTSTLFNLLALTTELPINVLSETCSFLKNKLFSLAPTNPLTQGIRSLLLLSTIGLQSAFKGVYYLLRTITSPLVSYTDAKKIHPTLGYVSALTSVLFISAGIAALILFVPPVLEALTLSMGPKALAMLKTLAYPFVELFSAIHLSISTAMAATLSFISGNVFLGTFHMIGRKVIYPEASETKPKNEICLTPKLGSNVSNLLTKSSHDNDKEFELIDSPVSKSSDMLSTSFGRLKGVAEKNAINDFNLEGIQATIDSKSSL